MPFNGTGTWTLPAGQPVASGTVISATTFNTLVADVGNSFNNCLPRDGQASLTSVLKLQDGTSGAPSLTFNSETNTGLWRPSAGLLSFNTGGIEVMRLKSNGAVMIGTTTDNGTSKLQVAGDISATTFSGSFTGHASLDLALSGGTLTGPLIGTAATFSSTLTINSATVQPLRLITSNGVALAMTLERSDLGASSSVINDTGTRWNFQHRPSFANATPLDSVNYTSYSPTTNGTGAVGTWGINITGNAATATTSTTTSGNAATATLAVKSSTLSQSGGTGPAMTFSWSGQTGQPNWLWGGNDGLTHYVYNPSNFNVASAAACSGNSATVTHNFGRTDGTAYPIVWAPAGGAQPMYSCAAVTINSSIGQIGCSSLLASGEVTAYSDARLKTDVSVITDALAKLDAVRGVTFTKKDTGARGTGVIAQELQTVLPEAVQENADGMLSVAYGNVVGLLIEAVKELSAKVALLEGAKA